MILEKRQLNSCTEWKAFGEKLSGSEIPDFDEDRYLGEYTAADKEDRNNTFIGHFISASLSQKSMVTRQIFESGNLMAGYTVEYKNSRFQGIKDFIRFVEQERKGGRT